MAVKQTAEDANIRRNRIIAAATTVFLRYGHARTTMNDVAEEAGISRPALYLVFPHKDQIFTAVIQNLIHDELKKYREALPRLKTLNRKLHFCCEQWAGHGYDLTKAKTTPEELAGILIFGMRGFKDVAEDGSHMRRLIALQVDAVLALVKAH